MALTEQEEFELLSLEREKYLFSQQQTQVPEQITQPQTQPSIFETPANTMRQQLGEPSWFSNLPFVKKTDEFIEPMRQRILGAGLGAVNTGLMGIPEIISQKLTGRRLVPNKAPVAKAVGEIGGFAGGIPAKIMNLIAPAAQAIAPGKGILQSAARGALTGGPAAMSLLPSPEETPTMSKTVSTMRQRGAIGASVGGMFGMLQGTINKYGKWLKPKNQLQLAEETRNSLVQQKNNLIEKYGKVYDQTIKNGKGQVSLQEPLQNLLEESDDIVNTLKGNTEISEALGRGDTNAKRVMNLVDTYLKNPQEVQNLTLQDADGLQKYIRNLSGIRSKLASQYKGRQVDFTNAERVLLNFANDIKAQVMNLAPEMNLVNKEYGQFMNNYKQLRPYLKWDKAITTFLDINNPQKVALVDLMQKTLPQEVMNNIANMNRAVKAVDLLKKIGGVVGLSAIAGETGRRFFRK